MEKGEKLLERAVNSPANLRFSELCKLAESFGWVLDRQKGSHRIYENTSIQGLSGMRLMVLTDKKGKCDVYQVRQLIAAIESLKDK